MEELLVCKRRLSAIWLIFSARSCTYRGLGTLGGSCPFSIRGKGATFVNSVCVSAHNVPSEKGSTLNGKTKFTSDQTEQINLQNCSTNNGSNTVKHSVHRILTHEE